MESLQILLNQMGEGKVILTYTELPKPIFATYYRDKHISAIGINRLAMITKRFEFEVFKAAVGLHRTLSGADYKIIIDDNNIDMLAPVGEALMIDQGIIIGNRIVLNKPDSKDYSNLVFHRVNSLESMAGKALSMYKLMPKEEHQMREYRKMRNLLRVQSYELSVSNPESYEAIKDKIKAKIDYYNSCLMLS